MDEVSTHRSVLLIEDDVPAANGLRALLDRAAGRRLWVWHEHSVAAARRLLGACCFDLILLDPLAPDGPPDEIYRAVRHVAPHTPIAILAAEAATSAAGRPENANDDENMAGVVAVIPRGEEQPLRRVLREVLHIRLAPATSWCTAPHLGRRGEDYRAGSSDPAR